MDCPSQTTFSSSRIRRRRLDGGTRGGKYPSDKQDVFGALYQQPCDVCQYPHFVSCGASRDHRQVTFLSMPQRIWDRFPAIPRSLQDYIFQLHDHEKGKVPSVSRSHIMIRSNLKGLICPYYPIRQYQQLLSIPNLLLSSIAKIAGVKSVNTSLDIFSHGYFITSSLQCVSLRMFALNSKKVRHWRPPTGNGAGGPSRLDLLVDAIYDFILHCEELFQRTNNVILVGQVSHHSRRTQDDEARWSQSVIIMERCASTGRVESVIHGEM